MGLLDNIRNLLGGAEPDHRPVRYGRPPRQSQRMRHTVDTDSLSTFGSAMQYVSSPDDPEGNWRLNNFDAKTLDKISTAELLTLLADVSPEVSRALWDFLRFCNPGWEVTVTRPGSENEDVRGQALVNAFLDQLSDYYGSVDILFGRMFFGAFMRGAFMAELVLDDAGRMPVDLVVPDPATARFKRATDDVRGKVWQLGQWQRGQWVPLDYPTIRYIPIDPAPGKPYGRPPVAPAVFSSLFLIGMLHDLRRVVQQQGYPRLDLSVQMETIAAAMPPDVSADPAKFNEWVEATIDEVQSVYASLEPDDAYIHTDVIQVNRPVGTVDASSLGAIDGLIRGLERMVTRALKTMPLLMGSNEAVSETHANRQWEIHAAGIKSLQHLAETMLERLFGLALQVQGVQANVRFRFAELRASEMLRDAQTETIQIANERAKYQAGWISQDEAALAITGHEADLPEPRVLDLGGRADIVAGDIANTVPEESNRQQTYWEIREAIARIDASIERQHRHPYTNGAQHVPSL